MTDQELLHRYLAARDQEAFAQLVHRHISLVYSAARRQSPADAADITQAVFLLLAQKAGHVARHTSAAAWLFRTTRFCCLNAIRLERRRKHHEREAARMIPEAPSFPLSDQDRQQLLTELDHAIAALPARYRETLLLRYLEGKSLEETAGLMNLAPTAVAKTAGRAIDKLRTHFRRAGLTLGTATLQSVLTEESAAAVPVGLAHSITAGAVLPAAAASAKSLLLSKTTAHSLLTAHLKTAAAITVITLSAAAIGGQKILAHRGATSSPGTKFIAARTPAPTPEEEAKLPGDLCFVVFDLLVDANGAAALRSATKPIQADTAFFELRQGSASDIRETIRSIDSNGQIIVLPKASLDMNRARVRPGETWKSSDQTTWKSFGYTVRPPNAYSFNISFPNNNYLSASTEGPGIDFKLDFQNVRARLTIAPAAPLDKPATIRWSGQVEPGRMVMMLGDWGEWSGEHPVAARFIEVHKATETEQYYIDRLGTTQWITGGPATVRQEAQRAMVWAAKGELSAGGLGIGGKWTRTLSDGATVELINIARPDQWPLCWWDPAGNPHPYVYPRAQTTKESQGPLAATVRFHPRYLTLGTGLYDRTDFVSRVELSEEDKRIELYAGVGPWKEQPLVEGQPVNVGTATFTLSNVGVDNSRANRTLNGAKPVSAKLDGNPGPETEFMFGVVTKDHRHIVRTPQPRVLVTQPPPPPTGVLLIDPNAPTTFDVTPEEFDHFVLLTRTREKITFENFADTPAIPVPQSPTPEDIRAAQEKLLRNKERELDQWWAASWKERSADLADLESITRDRATPAGSMRLLADKALAGDLDAVRGYLEGEDAVAAAIAKNFTTYGKLITACDRKFGRETMELESDRASRLLVSNGTPTAFHTYFDRVYLPVERLLAYQWMVDQDRASSSTRDVTLLRRDGTWRIDLNHWLQYQTAMYQGSSKDPRALVLGAITKDTAEEEAILADLQSGKISAAQTAERIGKLYHFFTRIP